ncbi:MAG: hypothetical protein Q9214_007841, partial [Letrouitia sp. 1 TL-2023]
NHADRVPRSSEAFFVLLTRYALDLTVASVLHKYHTESDEIMAEDYCDDESENDKDNVEVSASHRIRDRERNIFTAG